MTTACTDCIDDSFLSQIASNEGNIGYCNICNKDELPVISSERIGQLLEPILKERLALGEDMRVFSEPDDDKGEWEQQGDPLEYFVSEFLGQDFECLDEIISAVMDAEDVWPPDGDQPFFDHCYNYVPVHVAPRMLLHKWQSIHDEIYKSQRFFSASAKSFFDFLFQDIQQLLAPTSDGVKSVVRDFPVGSTLFRARTYSSHSLLQNVFDNPMLHAGPPPAEYARAGRMNAEGVSVLYGALDSDTAIAELRPPLGGDTLVISLKTRDHLRLLDFERLESVFSSVSHFDPDYYEKAEKHAFLKRLHSLISRPIVPGKENEYLITQTMAEYLAHVHEQPFDGILFSSVQNQGGRNVVIFKNASGSFPVDYVDGSLKMFYTREIQHSHTERHIYETKGRLHIIDFDEDFDPDDW